MGSPKATQLILAQGARYQSSVGRRVAIVLSFRERGAPSTHRHHGPELVSSHIHIFTAPAVGVQHEVTVHIIVKTSVQLGHAVAHTEWVGPPGYEHTLRIHMDREVREQQHFSFLRASHGPIASSIWLRTAAQLLGGNASDPEVQSLGACPSRGKFHQSNRPTRTVRRPSS